MGHPMNEAAPTVIPEYGVEFKTVDGMYIRQISIPSPAILPQHSHHWAHSTLLARGSVILWREGLPESRHEAPAIIWIPAETKHWFQTLVPDCLLYCLHNLHEADAVRVLAETELSEDFHP